LGEPVFLVVQENVQASNPGSEVPLTVKTPSYPCSSCGATLEFSPGKNSLKCSHCGTENAISPGAGTAVEEFDYQEYLAKAAGNEPQIERQTVNCPGCGATTQMSANVTSDRCPFCAVPLIAADAHACRTIKPHAIAPFDFDVGRARTRFKDWIDGLWFAPTALKQQAIRETGTLKGIYLPYWTYDAKTETTYAGRRGDHYHESETYVDNGATKTRQVQRTRWSPAAGAVQLRFDDILVSATTSLPPDNLEKLEPWNLKNLQPYREDYLAGFVVEAYQLGLEPGFQVACQRMEGPIRQAIQHDIGGDEQQILNLSSRHDDIRFKHILLPIWLSTYRYGGKTWRFLVNGQTGEVQGERPWSVGKIALAVSAALLAVLAMIALLGKH
jgi:LSD1 subclass zinc finger protein